MIRKVKATDAAEICEIYNHYILKTTTTFEIDPLTEEEFSKRLQDISTTYPYLVYEENGTIVGYAYASIFRTRVAYKNTVETSVYVHPNHFQKGIGKELYADLIKALKQTNFHSAIGGITLPNEPSVILHEKMGFVKIGHFKEVGFKFNQWLDVGFWQLML